MSTRNIIHVITTIERGGAENAVATLAIAQSKKGHSVSVLPLKGNPELLQKLEANGVRVILSCLNKPIHLQLRNLKKEVMATMIVHAHLPRSELLCRLALGKGRAILTRHNAETFFPKAPRFVSLRLSQWVTKDATLIAISNAVLT